MALPCRLFVAVLLTLFIARPALADEVQIRVATHEGYARIAFDWPKPVPYETHIDGNTLTIHFGRPISAKLDLLPAGLKEYIAAVSTGDDGKSVIVQLRKPMDAKAFLVNQKIVAIDLSTAVPPSAAAKPPEPAAKTALSDAPPADKPASEKPAADGAAKEKPAPPVEAKDKPAPAKDKPPAKPVAVPVTIRKERTATNLRFHWPDKVDYDFSEKDGVARLRFQRAGIVGAERLSALLPDLGTKVEENESAVTISFKVPDGVTLTPYRSGTDVVVEIIGKPKPPEIAKAPPETERRGSTDIAPPKDVAPSKELAEEPPGKAAKGKPIPPTPPTKPMKVAAPAKETPAPVVPPSSATAALPATLAVRYLVDGDVSSLRFDWPAPTAAAVYRRASAIWIVFAASTKLDLSDPRSHGQQVFRSIDQLAVSEATVLRFVARDGLNPSVRRVGASWVVDLKNQPAQSDAPIAFEARPSANPPDVNLRVKQASSPLRLHDPDAGDTLIVVPVADLGRGVNALQGFIDFRALPSVQGVVIHPEADDLVVRADLDNIDITRPGGLTLSSERDRLLGRALDTTHRLFDFAAWRAENEDFLTRRSHLEQAVAAAPLAARSKPRLDLARFYFASMFGAEALGVLDAIARDDPETAAQPAVRALRGASCLLAHDLKCASDDFSLHALDNEPEAVLWRGSLAAEIGSWDDAAADFISSVSLLPFYPTALRDRFLLQAAEAMLDTDQAEAAKPLIELVMSKQPDIGEKAMGLYLSGRVEQATGHLDNALDMWRKVVAMNDRPSRARALYFMSLAELDAGKATREETIKSLDALRFSWRGDAFEFGLLRRLGDLKLEAGDYRNGLAALREAVSNFPDYPAAKQINQQIADRFAELFLGKEADDLSPLRALALYDEFHDIEPPGDRSDAIVRKLVDRLVSVDLLDRAAGLLDEQVNHRLTGKDKARVATQLALLRLLDHDPDAATKALDIDVGRDLPPELARQRQQLRARALLDLGRPDDALSILDGDTSRDADRLRADVYWRGHNWAEAVKTFARLAPTVGPDGKLDGEAEHLVLSWAAALTLAGDQDGLGKLVETYGKAMDVSPSAKIFHVIADDVAAPNTMTDPRQIAGQIAQIGELQSFMANYRQRLAADKLSAIN